MTSEQNAEIFFAWVAQYDGVYHLGTRGTHEELLLRGGHCTALGLQDAEMAA